MNALPDLIPCQISLVVLDHPAMQLTPGLIADLALRGPLRVLDAGNCFAAYPIARHLRRATADLSAALQRIQVARAFTCHQVLALLEDSPADTLPVLVLDLLSTFLDENVRLAERRRLLLRCTQELERISRHAPVGIIVRLRAARPEILPLLQILEEAADQSWRFASDPPIPPARLF